MNVSGFLDEMYSRTLVDYKFARAVPNYLLFAFLAADPERPHKPRLYNCFN